jgi:hypothetical protein
MLFSLCGDKKKENILLKAWMGCISRNKKEEYNKLYKRFII